MGSSVGGLSTGVSSRPCVSVTQKADRGSTISLRSVCLRFSNCIQILGREGGRAKGMREEGGARG